MNQTISLNLLKDFYISNKDKLSKIKVNKKLYGKYDYCGVHKYERNPVPNFKIKDFETHFYEAEERIWNIY